MKSIVTATLVIAMMILFISPSKTYAVGKDTLVVYASGPSLDQIINSDTTSNGMQKHGVYKLVSLDTTYLYLGPITVKSDFEVIGVLGPNGRPPTIQPGVLQNGSMPSYLFVINGTGTTAKFKNFYIFELSLNNSWDWGKDFVVTADFVKLYLDNIIVEENRGEVIAYTGLHDNFYVTNSKFINGVYPSNWFSSVILTADWPTSNPADTVVMKNNTVFCINGLVVNPGSSAPLKYLEFTHNTLAYSFSGPPLNVATVLSAKINDNIFYGMFAAGGADKLWLSKTGSMIAIDTVDAATDLSRTIEIKDNIYFQPKAITDFWKGWNDTTKPADSIYVPSWMNARTTAMFNNKTRWPGFEESGNLVNVDPGFGSSLQSITDNTSSGPTVGLLQYIEEVRNGTISTDDWGYKQQKVVGDYWIPAWPLVEQTDGALKYTAILTAPDGKPYGDPYWFTLAPSPSNLSIVSNGRTYVGSASPSANYSDPNGVKLTDGKFAAKAYFADPAWVGYSSPGKLDVVIDLGKEQPVQQFMGEYLLDPQPAINLPSNITVSISTDNSTFTLVDTLKDSSPNIKTSSIHKYYYTLSRPVNARYVKFSTKAQAGAWIFVDEYQVLGEILTDVRQLQENSIPANFDLSNNYPNPFNPTTNINFSLEKPSQVTLSVYNILGQKVATLVNSFMQAGKYTYQFDASKLASGVYIYRIEAGNFISAKKMTLMK